MAADAAVADEAEDASPVLAAAAPKEEVPNSAEAVAAESGPEEDVRARLEGVAALASSIQPTGSTLATTKVLTRVWAPGL